MLLITYFSVAPEGAMPGFVDFMYKNILPACFLAPLKPTFDLNDGHTFVVRQHLQCMYIVCGNIGLGPYSVVH